MTYRKEGRTEDYVLGSNVWLLSHWFSCFWTTLNSSCNNKTHQLVTSSMILEGGSLKTPARLERPASCIVGFRFWCSASVLSFCMTVCRLQTAQTDDNTQFCIYFIIKIVIVIVTNLQHATTWTNLYKHCLYSSVVITQFIWWMLTECQVVANCQTKPSDVGCESACRLLLSMPTVTIYYYYSVRRLILILTIPQRVEGWVDLYCDSLFTCTHYTIQC